MDGSKSGRQGLTEKAFYFCRLAEFHGVIQMIEAGDRVMDRRNE